VKLQAELTYGWPMDQQSPLSASSLHAAASQSNLSHSYADALAAALQQGVQATALSADKTPMISGLDALFRRRTGGFAPLKQFLGALSLLLPQSDYPQPLTCQIDAFAWSFLKGAKNLDLLLPATRQSDAMRAEHQRWLKEIRALERFERLGIPLPEHAAISGDTYLALRAIVTRPSARDERRALASLLVSGPSTIAEITHDLGLNYSLGERSLAIFETKPLALLQRRDECFALRAETLPLVLFGLRETMGLDLLDTMMHNPKAA
jgi:hypothetical protein